MKQTSITRKSCNFRLSQLGTESGKPFGAWQSKWTAVIIGSKSIRTYARSTAKDFNKSKIEGPWFTTHKTTLTRSLVDSDLGIFGLLVESLLNVSRLDGDVAGKGASRDILGDTLVRAGPNSLLQSFKRGWNDHLCISANRFWYSGELYASFEYRAWIIDALQSASLAF